MRKRRVRRNPASVKSLAKTFAFSFGAALVGIWLYNKFVAGRGRVVPVPVPRTPQPQPALAPAAPYRTVLEPFAAPPAPTIISPYPSFDPFTNWMTTVEAYKPQTPPLQPMSDKDYFMPEEMPNIYPMQDYLTP